MNRAGFTLLISVLLVSTILLIAAAAAARGLRGQLDTTTTVDHALDAKALAEGCADAALVELTQDQTYPGNETIDINGQPCLIDPIVFGTPTIVETSATVNGQTYRLHIELSELNPVTISLWQRE